MQSTRIPRPGAICQLCEFHLKCQRLQTRQFHAIAVREKAQPTRGCNVPLSTPKRSRPTFALQQSLKVVSKRYQGSRARPTAADAAVSIGQLQKEADKIIKHGKVPSEEETLAVLRKFQQAADAIFGKNEGDESKSQSSEGTAASALLSLDGEPSPSLSLNKTVELISNLAYNIAKHPTVFISPKVLEVYATTQIQLQRPSTLPEIFDLYASKPVPQPNTQPTKYSAPNFSAIANAIPYPLATRALSCAITTKDLPAALSLIETSFRAPAWPRSKALKSGLLPLVGFAFAPAAAYALASRFSLLSSAVDPATATPLVATGILVYLGCVGTLGFVAVSTANDQMRRVTWVDGTPLWQRWVREEERAAVDRVAVAWGLMGKERWGEEEGPEWEFLKEWIGMRGMILDKVSLMEGME